MQCDGDSDRQTNPPETEASITSLEIVVYIAYMQTTKRESWGNNGNVANQSQTLPIYTPTIYTNLLVYEMGNFFGQFLYGQQNGKQ